MGENGTSKAPSPVDGGGGEGVLPVGAPEDDLPEGPLPTDLHPAGQGGRSDRGTTPDVVTWKII